MQPPSFLARKLRLNSHAPVFGSACCCLIQTDVSPHKLGLRSSSETSTTADPQLEARLLRVSIEKRRNRRTNKQTQRVHDASSSGITGYNILDFRPGRKSVAPDQEIQVLLPAVFRAKISFRNGLVCQEQEETSGRSSTSKRRRRPAELENWSCPERRQGPQQTAAQSDGI